ncbi:hypothetical protein D5S18_24000 [Nocardia panacis]|uniref:RDD domain-containing protein n=1 Tax=Nocardia panacis TaxID=2340916 RepID=A0A3A4K598_9NOCA|nr:RDD family protein [Nocardia panacis]RJO72225.1 hypothetical protein D5S18_24000 [Nocardia panacis]
MAAERRMIPTEAMTNPHTAPPAGSWPATKSALRRAVTVSLLSTLGAIACVAVLLGIWVAIVANWHRGGAAFSRIAAAPTVAAFVIGYACLLVSGDGWRKRRALRGHSWICWPARYVSHGNNQWIQLIGPTGASMAYLDAKGGLFNDSTAEVWFAGDPQSGGLLSRPGGGDLCTASPKRVSPSDWERHCARLAHQVRRRGAPLTPEQERLVAEYPEQSEPRRHGALSDSGYPSPRRLRRTLAFAFDWVFHIACGFAAMVLATPHFVDVIAHRDWSRFDPQFVWVFPGWVAASILDRTVVQAVFHTTVGKGVFGLVVLRPEDGGYPSFWRLLKVWLFHLYLPLTILGDGPGPDRLGDYFLPAVRRGDVRAAHRPE